MNFGFRRKKEQPQAAVAGNREGKVKGAKKPPHEFKDSASAEEYLEWREEVPLEFRRLVEAKLKDAPGRRSTTNLPLTDQFLNSFADALKGTQSGTQASSHGADRRVADLLEPLARIETRGGFLNVFETLANPDISWQLRKNIYDTQIRPILEYLVEEDLEEAKKQEQEQAKEKEVPEETPAKPQTQKEFGEPQEGEKDKGEQEDENDVPPSSEKVDSAVESNTETKERKPKALFSVKPHYGDYYRQLVFDEFDPATLEWKKADNEFRDAEREPLDPLSARLLFGKIKGGASLALPLPYDWAVDISGLETDAPARLAEASGEAQENSVEILRNQDGLWYLKVNATGIFKYRLKIARRQFIEESERFKEGKIEGELPAELKEKIDELKKQNLPRLKLKREIVKLVRGHFKYSKINQALYQKFKSDPSRYFQQIWGEKKANCFFVGTLAARAVAEVDNQFRFVSGYSVRDKNDAGDAIMHTGNGHAWIEVYDEMSRRSVLLDATPAGDPNVDTEQQEQDLEGNNMNQGGEGDYGEEEMASEEETKKQIRDLKKKEGSGGGRKEKTGPNLIEQQFADLAECTPEQAREFMRALERVREIRNEQGVSISELLKEEWKKIIEERKIERPEYKGPVRMDEGDRLEDPVEAMIDIRSKEFNPGGFEKDVIVEKMQSDFGGLHVYYSFDLSDSMKNPDAATGRSKVDVQRDAALLFVDSLMQAAYATRQHGEESDLLPLKIMVTLASSTGQVGLHLTDKWGPKEQWAMYSALIRPASGGTPTHETLELIEKDFDKEAVDLKKKGIAKEKYPLSYVVEVSDGVPDDFDETENAHIALKKKGVVVRSYVIGGASSSADAAPPLQSFSELPKILSEDIIEKFKKLRPNRIKQ